MRLKSSAIEIFIIVISVSIQLTYSIEILHRRPCVADKNCASNQTCSGIEAFCTNSRARRRGQIRCKFVDGECELMVGKGSRCEIRRLGECKNNDKKLCHLNGVFLDKCPKEYECIDSHCVSMDEISNSCSSQHECSKRGLQCCRSSMQCSSECECQSSKDCFTGELCDSGKKCAFIDCITSFTCPTGSYCSDGICTQLGTAKNTLEEEEEVQISNNEPEYLPKCSRSSPNGACPPGQTCREGKCIRDSFQIPLCSTREPSGSCPPGQICRSGQCQTPTEECGANNWQGICPEIGDICRNGVCVSEWHRCSGMNPHGFCPPGEMCRSGRCSPKSSSSSKSCSAFDPCANGYICERGQCRIVCSKSRQDGFCPQGKVCDRGQCRPIAKDDKCNPKKCRIRGGVCLVNRAGDGLQCATLCSRGDVDCPAERICVKGRCEREECVNVKCNPDEVCRRNVCEKKHGETWETTLKIDGICSRTNPECPEGRVCRRGHCVPKSFLGVLGNGGTVRIDGIGQKGVSVTLG